MSLHFFSKFYKHCVPVCVCVCVFNTLTILPVNLCIAFVFKMHFIFMSVVEKTDLTRSHTLAYLHFIDKAFRQYNSIALDGCLQ